MTQIQLATTEKTKDAVYRFRYNIYVKEMKFFQEIADQKRAMLKDELDENGDVFIALKNDEIIGTVASNYSSTSNIAKYEKLYEMVNLGKFHPRKTSIATKLMVAPKYRGSYLAVRLILSMYAKWLKDGVKYNVMSCSFEMQEFYQRLGYKVYKQSIKFPTIGEAAVMLLDVEDLEHLQVVKSPFFRYYQKWTNSIKKSKETN